MKYSVIKYSKIYYSDWNGFINSSKNGTFLFHRDFMEYHSDRFEDFSLLVFEKTKLVAVVPANMSRDTIYSHQGLTYGGLVYNEKLKQSSVILVFKCILQFLHENNFTTFHVKQIPYIYHKLPSQEVEYVIFLTYAKLVRRDALAVIENSSRLKIASNRMEGIRKGIAHRLIVRQSNDFSGFWNTLLIPNLRERHDVKPVHTLDEISSLKNLFPDNIKLFIIEEEGRIAAGTVLFVTETVVHVQYIAAGADKNEVGSLDFLFYYLINEEFCHKKYFDFGISNEEQGRKLNEGLVFWKESFGARTLVQDFYEVETANYKLLDIVLI